MVHLGPKLVDHESEKISTYFYFSGGVFLRLRDDVENEQLFQRPGKFVGVYIILTVV